MKRGTNFILTSLIALTGAVNAQAQDAATSAEKQAPLKTILPGSYGRLELRHSVARRMEGEEVTNDIPKLDIRPTLGSTFFDGRFDTSFTWIFRKAADTTAVKKLILYNESKWTLLEGRFGDIGPNALTYQSDDQSFNESYVGIDANLKRDFAADHGTITLSGYMGPAAAIRSGKDSQENKVSVRNDTGNDNFALDSTGSTEIEQRDPTLWNYSGVQARFKPSLLPEFYVGLGVDLAQKWDPKYAASEVEGDTRVERVGYATSAVTSNVLKLGYKVSDDVTVAGALRQNVGGYYQQGLGEDSPDPTGYWGATRWESRLSLQATLY
jgi:hypothetical protein